MSEKKDRRREPTPDELELIAMLRVTLPPILKNPPGIEYSFSSRIAIDCEWDSDGDGGLTMVGVGNRHLICQFWWCELDDAAKARLKADLIDIVKSHPVVYWNADADLRKLRAHGFPLDPRMHKQLDDAMLAHGVLFCEEDHDLRYVQSKLGSLPEYKHLRLVKGAEDVYNAADLIEPLAIMAKLEAEFAADPQRRAENVYREQRLAKLPYVIEDEERGIAVNQLLAYEMRDELAAKREKAIRLAKAYSGWDIQLSSPDDVKVAVFGVGEYPVQYAKSAPGDKGPAPSIWAEYVAADKLHTILPMMFLKPRTPTLDKDALAFLRRSVGTEFDPDDPPTFEEALNNIDTGGDPLLEARYLFLGAQQALSHYVDPCFVWEGKGDKAQIAGVRERIYPEIRQHVQTSGRDSYVGTDWPGRAGIPVQQLRGKMELILRPDPGYVWVGHDWSNIETWLLGVLAGDPLLLEAKEKGWDTHTINYCDISGTPYPPILTKALHTAPECAAWREQYKWTGDEDLRRTFTKRWVYRIHYRGKPEYATNIPGAKALEIDAERSIACAERYLNKHHWIREYWTKIDHDVDTFGIIYAPGGMPRRLTSKFTNARRREGGNHPMQGGVAWVYNETRLAVHRMIEALKLDAWFVFGKHDSHWWSVREDQVSEFNAFYRPLVQREFEVAGQMVSFPASFKERKSE